MVESCRQELCELWGGDGRVCPCALMYSDDELPGMWERADFMGGQTDDE